MVEKVNYAKIVEKGQDCELSDEELQEEEDNLRTYHETFNKLKEIGKELLFAGASRTVRNLQGDTPYDLLERNDGLLKPEDMVKMKYILSAPKGCQCLRLTRPIQKVERTTTTQVVMLLFDIVNMSFFVIAATYAQSTTIKSFQQFVEDE